MRITAWLRRHRRLLVAAGLFLAGLLLFAAFWWLSVADARQKGSGSTLNPTADPVWLPVGAGLSQAFTAEGPFYAIGVLPRFGEQAAGTLTLELLDGVGALLGRATAEAAGLLSEQWAVFAFGGPAQSEDGRYILRFSAPDTENMALAASAGLPAGWAAPNGGDTAAGGGTASTSAPTTPAALSLLAVTEQIGGFLTGFYWAFALLASCVAPALWLLAGRKGLPVHRLFAVALLALCALYCFILPPYAAPDEQFHINQAFDQSGFILGEAPFEVDWGLSYRRASDYDEAVMNRDTTVFTYRHLASNLFTLAEDPTPTVYRHEEVGGSKLPYVASSLGVLAGRLLGLGFVPVLYLGRLFNILACAALMALAVKLAPFGKTAFMVAGLLPSTLHLVASFSRDGVIIALSFLYTALFLRLWAKPTVNGRDMLFLALLALALGPMKYVYSPVLLLPLLLPAQKLTLRGMLLSRRAAWGLRAAYLLVCLLPMLAFMWPYAQAALQGLFTSGAAAAPAASAPAAAQAQAAAGEMAHIALPERDTVTFTPANMLQHPGLTLRVVLGTLATQLGWYWQTLVGGSLGYFSIPISWGFVVVLSLFIAAAALPARHQTRQSPLLRGRWQAAGWLLLLATAGLVVVACLMWTPTYYTTIYGLQGRYLLPVLPLALVLLRTPLRRFSRAQGTGATLMCCTAVTSLLVLFNAFLVILAR